MLAIVQSNPHLIGRFNKNAHSQIIKIYCFIYFFQLKNMVFYLDIVLNILFKLKLKVTW
jgi:hypothetical protein